MAHLKNSTIHEIKLNTTLENSREVVVAQLTGRLLQIPEDPSSNPVIGNFYCTFYFLLTVRRKDENEEKEAGNCPLFKFGEFLPQTLLFKEQ